MAESLSRVFGAIVRSVETLEAMIEGDPYAEFELPPHAKRVVTFLESGLVPAGVVLPIEQDGARILKARAREVFSAYVPGPKGPVFMALIESAFGTNVTTRTWDTVAKCARAGRR